MPLFNLGSYKSGLIADSYTIRAYPLGNIAQRTIGYTSLDSKGNKNSVGIEGSYDKYLNGKDGKVLHVHTGYSGPATGIAHKELTDKIQFEIEMALELLK